MKYIDEFRDGKLARNIAMNIASEVNPYRSYNLMEFCGGHTHAISRYGIADILPANIHLIHGPGCPVCVLPVGKIEYAIHLAQVAGVILCCYGDMLRIPTTSGMSLMKVKAQGADIRMVYSSADAIKIAEENLQQQVVFLPLVSRLQRHQPRLRLNRRKDSV